MKMSLICREGSLALFNIQIFRLIGIKKVWGNSGQQKLTNKYETFCFLV